MPVLGLNHLNVRTPDFKLTVEFLRDALGMKVSPVPELDSIEKAAWIYDDSGAPVLHLASADVPYSPTEVLPARTSARQWRNPPRRAFLCGLRGHAGPAHRARSELPREPHLQDGRSADFRAGSERHFARTQFQRRLRCPAATRSAQALLPRMNLPE